jgi:hypothetical protein
MSLGLAHGRSSKEKSVGTYYNYKLDIGEKRESKRPKTWSERTCGRFHDKLVNSLARSTVLLDSGTGSLGEAESSNVKLGNLEDSLIISHGSDNNDGSVSSARKHAVKQGGRTYFFPRCLTILLRETGGLMVLEATSLLRTVLQNLDSVLLERNLKSCEEKGTRLDTLFGTYSHEEMLIKILAFRVLLELVLDSTSLD